MRDTQLTETRDKLVRMRQSRNISQNEMADRLQMSQPAVCRFECGCSLGWHSLLNYAHALDMELEISIV